MFYRLGMEDEEDRCRFCRIGKFCPALQLFLPLKTKVIDSVALPKLLKSSGPAAGCRVEARASTVLKFMKSRSFAAPNWTFRL
jgi:hypothetical protein